jgi:Ran GTPase-activating protein (RanGAP) involved in mRNA processing and transport
MCYYYSYYYYFYDYFYYLHNLLERVTQVRDGEIHVLDLGNNSMGAEGADALARLLMTKTQLKELNLYMNDVGSIGIGKVEYTGIM